MPGASTWGACLLLALAVGFVYAPVAGHGFVNFDDPQYVSDNPHLRDGLTARGVAWAFTTGRAGNWHPLTWLSHMLDVRLFGLDAGAHHVVSALLHLSNTLLLFGLLLRTTGARLRSAWVAAMFGVHPLHVESVAWLAERKDVLSAFFGLLALLAYLRYARRPGAARMTLVAACLALGLLAKPMLVTLPFVMLLLDRWPLDRLLRPQAAPVASRFGDRQPLRRLVAEKLPLFVLVAASSVVTLAVQRQAGAVKGLDVLPLGQRAANAAVAYAGYVGQVLWPVRLAPLYPYPASLPGGLVAAALAGLAAVTFVALRAERRQPAVAVGWLWYLGTLVPVIGLVQVGSQPHADRYTYLPAVGLFVAVAWGLHSPMASSQRRRAALGAAAALSVGAGALAARGQVIQWTDSVSLWRHAIRVTGDNPRAHHNLGHALLKQGRVAEATAELEEAVRLAPGSAEAHATLGLALAGQGKLGEAIVHYSEALRLAPEDVEAHNNLGLALAAHGDNQAAIDRFSTAVLLRPELGVARNNLGAALARDGRFVEAVRELEQAVRLQPDDPEPRTNLARALAALGRGQEAVDQYQAALSLAPDQPVVHNALGAVLDDLGRGEDALAHFTEALRLAPELADARANRGRILASRGRLEEAIVDLAAAVRSNPGDADSQYDLGVVLLRAGRDDEARAQFERVLSLEPGHPGARHALDALRRAPAGRGAGPR